MKPIPGAGLSAKKRKFNSRISRACVVVECAFGRVKGRWRSLLKHNDMKIELMTTYFTACCILHMYVRCIKTILMIIGLMKRLKSHAPH